jgi:F-type H+-transporting ATPase subunit O
MKKSVQVPLVLHGIEGRYATALYSAAVKSKALDAVNNDISRIASLIAKDLKIQSFLMTPIVDRSAKKEGVTQLLSQGKYNSITSNFFGVLAENGRLDQTSKVIDSFSKLMTAHRGEVTATITSTKVIL